MGPLERFAALARARNDDIKIQENDIIGRPPSLARALARPGIVAELKPASPTEGRLRDLSDAAPLARGLARAGAAGLSALTEPTAFGGSPRLLRDAAASGAPALMKDFVVTERQLDLARACGASAVLLILPLLDARRSDWPDARAAVEAAHARGLEVLLEAYDAAGLRAGLDAGADVLGVNNRDLRDPRLPVDPGRAARALAEADCGDTPVLALSGAKDAADVRAQVEAGARGVLAGTALMRADDPVAKLRELMEGLR